MMDIPARVYVIIAGFVFILISAYVPDETDQAKLITAHLEDISHQIDLCKDNPCKANLEQTFRYVKLSLDTVELNNTIKSAFFFAGLLLDIGTVISFVIIKPE